jgi:hypothetical protein
MFVFFAFAPGEDVPFGREGQAMLAAAVHRHLQIKSNNSRLLEALRGPPPPLIAVLLLHISIPVGQITIKLPNPKERLLLKINL